MDDKDSDGTADLAEQLNLNLPDELNAFSPITSVSSAVPSPDAHVENSGENNSGSSAVNSPPAEAQESRSTSTESCSSNVRPPSAAPAPSVGSHTAKGTPPASPSIAPPNTHQRFLGGSTHPVQSTAPGASSSASHSGGLVNTQSLLSSIPVPAMNMEMPVQRNFQPLTTPNRDSTMTGMSPYPPASHYGFAQYQMGNPLASSTPRTGAQSLYTNSPVLPYPGYWQQSSQPDSNRNIYSSFR